MVEQTEIHNQGFLTELFKACLELKHGLDELERKANTLTPETQQQQFLVLTTNFKNSFAQLQPDDITWSKCLPERSLPSLSEESEDLDVQEIPQELNKEPQAISIFSLVDAIKDAMKPSPPKELNKNEDITEDIKPGVDNDEKKHIDSLSDFFALLKESLNNDNTEIIENNQALAPINNTAISKNKVSLLRTALAQTIEGLGELGLNPDYEKPSNNSPSGPS